MSPLMPSAYLHTPRILVADAHDDTRLLYRASLGAVDCDVVEACDGRDALVAALTHRPALVITELQLAVLDGYALCELLRRDVVTRAVPILVATGEGRATQLHRARASGADVVLVKPISPEALLHAVRRLLEKQPAAPDSDGPAELPSRARHKTRAKDHQRFDTTTPPQPPPELPCPSCDNLLVYQGSHVGGVSARHPEQWDDYVCPSSCGGFQYRQRTRKLRRID